MRTIVYPVFSIKVANQTCSTLFAVAHQVAWRIIRQHYKHSDGSRGISAVVESAYQA
jgi:hypothetical protein